MRKIGVHIIGGYNGQLGPLPLYVLVNVTPQYVREVRALVGPEPLIVVRWVQSYQPLSNPEQEAVEWFSAHLADMLLATNNGADKRTIWQGMNEVPGCQAEALYWYEKRRGELMHPRGLLRGLFACSVGEYDPSIWRFLATLFPSMVAGEHALTHEYWDSGASIATRDWWVGRWRHVPELANIPLAVTECGRDYIVDGGVGYGKAGWRQTCGPEEFWHDLLAYDALLQRYPNVVGAAIFNCGYEGGWPNFACNELVPRLVANTEPSAPAPAPEPAPEQTEDSTGRLVIELSRPLALTPTTNVVTQWFGANPAMYARFGLAGHNGLDYRAPLGTPVLATHPGVVQIADQGATGLGKYVQIAYIDGRGETRYWTRYAHLSEFRVANGQRVKRGDVIGLSGNTGNSTGAHLHWDLRIAGMMNKAYGDRIDPCPWRTL